MSVKGELEIILLWTLRVTEFDLLVQKLGMTAFTSLYYLYFVLLLNSHSSLASSVVILWNS